MHQSYTASALANNFALMIASSSMLSKKVLKTPFACLNKHKHFHPMPIVPIWIDDTGFWTTLIALLNTTTAAVLSRSCYFVSCLALHVG